MTPDGPFHPGRPSGAAPLQLLGLCPALALADRLDKALALAAVLLAIHLCLPLLTRLMRRATPPAVDLPVRFLLAAALASAGTILLQAFAWDLAHPLGPYALVLAATAAALARPAQPSSPAAAWDGLLPAAACLALLAAAGAARELLAAGSLLGRPLLPQGWFRSDAFLASPAGALLVLAALLALVNAFDPREESP